MFLIIGLIFLLIGLYTIAVYGVDSIVLYYFLIGGILFVPGCYQTILIYKLVFGYGGYSYDSIVWLEDIS